MFASVGRSHMLLSILCKPALCSTFLLDGRISFGWGAARLVLKGASLVASICSVGQHYRSSDVVCVVKVSGVNAVYTFLCWIRPSAVVK